MNAKLYEIVVEERYKTKPTFKGDPEIITEVKTYGTYLNPDEAQANFKEVLGQAEDQVKEDDSYIYIKVYLKVSDCIDFGMRMPIKN